MTVRLALLNLVLKLGEQRFLARVQDPQRVRKSFERKARYLFRPPRGTTSRKTVLGGLTVRAIPGDRPVSLLYLHGGAYVFGSSKTHLGMVARLSQLTGCSAFVPEYRLAPENPFPAAFDDAVAVYLDLARQGPVALMGDSAGGGLALALLAHICDAGLPHPRMTVCFSPFTDMTFSGASIQRNRDVEVILPPGRLGELRDMYLQGADPADLRASPLLAEFTGAGPVVLLASDAELLEDDSVRLRDRLTRQGVEVEFLHGHAVPHVWPFFWRYLPQADLDLRRVADIMRARALL